jgi:transcriptional regulator NrdR family protein
MGMENFSRYQQGIIKRYYSNQETIQLQKLGELVTELYLAEGKKREKMWKTVATSLEKLEVPKQRIDHIVSQDNPELLAKLIKELLG